MFVWAVLVFLDQMIKKKEERIFSTRPVGFAAGKNARRAPIYLAPLLPLALTHSLSGKRAHHLRASGGQAEEEAT